MDSKLRIPEKMLADDKFSHWLGIQIEHITNGECRLKMTVRDEMTNGFKVSHGGIVFSLADSAVAFAANAHGKIAMSVDNSVHYAKAVFANDVLTATAIEKSRNNKTGHYSVLVSNQHNESVALFSGTVYFTSRTHELK